MGEKKKIYLEIYCKAADLTAFSEPNPANEALLVEHAGSRAFGGGLVHRRLGPCPDVAEHRRRDFAHAL